MSKRLVTTLWCIAGLLAALTLFVKSGQRNNNDAPTALSQGDVLLEDLSDKLNEVTAVKVESAENTVTIEKGESQWSVAERAGYEADFTKLTRLLRSLTEVSVAQNKKAGPAFNERFGMNPEAENQDSHGYQLTFLNAEGKELKSLSIGKSTAGEDSRPGSAGRYVRLSDEPESIYAVNESFFDLSADPTEWLSSDFFSINGIKSIKLTPAEDDTINGWTVSRSNTGSDFTIQNLAAGRQPQADKLTPLKNVLSGPRFEDVLTAEEAKERRDEEKARQLTIETFDGLNYLIDYAPIKAGETDPEQGTPVTSGYILKVTVTADFPKVREKKEGETEEEAKKADAEFAAAQEELKKKLAEEQAFGDKYFEVADYTLTALNIGLDALAKPVVKTEAVQPSTPQQSFGPLAPQPPLGEEQPPTPQPPRPTAVSPPIAIPPAPKPEEKPETKAEAEPQASAEEDDDSNNSDALNVLSEEDIKRIIEKTKEAEEAE